MSGSEPDSAARQPERPSAPSVGERLRTQRENRNASIDDLVDKTKIQRAYLEALERDAYDALPGRAFGKFYIRTYAEVLGFDPGPLIADYERVRSEDEGEEISVDPAPSARRRSVRWRPPRRAGNTVRPPADSAPDRAGSDLAGPVESRSAPPELASRAKEEPASASEPPPAVPSPDPVATVSTPESADLEATEARPDRIVESVVPVDAVAPMRDVAPPSGFPRRWWVAGGLVAAIAIVSVVALRGDRSTDPTAPVQPPADQPEVPGPASPSAPAESDRVPIARSAPEPAPLPPVVPSRLEVTDSGIGRRVVDHRLEGRGDRFEAGSVVYFSTRVLGGRRGDRVRHVWLHEGKTVQRVDLELGGPHWRTHSRKTLWATGRWTVEARDADGNVLATAGFTCVK